MFASHSILNVTLLGQLTVAWCMTWRMFCFQWRAIDIKYYTACVTVSAYV